jgi:anti-sigma factor RsiW
MSGETDGHVEDKLEAMLDGELTRAEASAVRAHCTGCKKCGAALGELEMIDGALEMEREPSPLRPMWPAVREALVHPSVPRFGFSFGLVTSAAAVAGVVLGVLLGSLDELPEHPLEAAETYSVGSYLGDDSVPTLDEIYVASFGEDGEEQ